MAERIEPLNVKPGRAEQYPWAEWMDGSAWRIKRGVDFYLTADAMRSNITARASRVGVRVKTTVPDEDTVDFQFVRMEKAA